MSTNERATLNERRDRIDEGIWTIGHSTRTADEFLTLLHGCGINSLVDVRSYPGSHRCPQFGREVMSAWLADDGIAYRHMSDLGGRRNKQHDVDSAINAAWKNASFKNYADYTLSDAYETALSDLIEMAQSFRVAYMCSEAVPWKCHRLIISNSLFVRGLTVHHIMSASKMTEHRLGQWGPEPVIADNKVAYSVPKSEKQSQRVIPESAGSTISVTSWRRQC